MARQRSWRLREESFIMKEEKKRVEPAPGDDLEGLEVTNECLTKANKLDLFLLMRR